MYGLEVDGLKVDYPTFHLNASMQVPKGCVTGLVGRNGAGKSTMIKAIMRQLDDAQGKILYDGKPFYGNEVEILNEIACVFDVPHFNTFYKPKTLKKLFQSIYRKFDGIYFDALMDRFQLPMDVRVNKFSFGMQRKFCLVLALSQRPRILLLDEPTAGVDPVDRAKIVDLIQEFMLDEEHTVLFSTHVTEDLDKIADYVAIMKEGEIVLEEEKEALLGSYRLVQAPEMTERLAASALGVQRSTFGYTFLIKGTQIDGEGIQIKTPTVEELFVHLLGEEEGER